MVTAELYELIASINKNMGITVIMVSHDMEATLKYASHILYISDETAFFGTKEEYMKMVEKSKEYIREGDIFQVVLSQRWSMEQDMHPFEIYRVLRSTNPSPYLFYFNFGDYKVAGSSPEMLVEMKNNRVKNCPIAGTRKRGKNTKHSNFENGSIE